MIFTNIIIYILKKNIFKKIKNFNKIKFLKNKKIYL